MYRATLYFTRGWGAESGTMSADSYKELKEKITSFASKTNKILGYETKVILNKVVYMYPSGKRYIETF